MELGVLGLGMTTVADHVISTLQASGITRVYGLPPAAYRESMPPAVTRARVPSCVLARDTRPLPDSRVKTAHGEKTRVGEEP